MCHSYVLEVLPSHEGATLAGPRQEPAGQPRCGHLMGLRDPARIAALALVVAAISACGESNTPATSPPPAGSGVTVAVQPATAQVQPSAKVAFAAAVTGALNTSVRWSVLEAAGGTVDTTGGYTAPGSAGVFHVVAVSVAEPTASGSATVTVTSPPPVVVTVTPATATVDACLTLTLAATVTGTSSTAVTWSVLEGAAGGSITPGGVYTASSTGGIYHLVATSVADPSKSATATVTVTERVLSVQVTPATITVPAGGTAQFTATVTTTCGSFASVAIVNAAGQVVAN
jgi:hypothetical protein